MMYKALIVDDEKPVHIAIKALGRWDQFQISSELLIAQNGQEALEVMDREQPDLIFLDICMPLMNGLDFLQIAKEKYPASQFIIVSGYDDFSYAQNAVRYGATDYLLKPIEREALNQAIEHAIKKLSLPAEEDKISATSGKSDLSSEEILEKIKKYIEQNYQQNIHVSDFAEEYFFSKEYLTKQFKAKYGFNIYEYLLRVRMEKAADLLLTDGVKIQDVGSQVGFPDNNHFSKAFKNYFEMSPSEYRKTHLPS